MLFAAVLLIAAAVGLLSRAKSGAPPVLGDPDGTLVNADQLPELYPPDGNKSWRARLSASAPDAHDVGAAAAAVGFEPLVPAAGCGTLQQVLTSRSPGRPAGVYLLFDSGVTVYQRRVPEFSSAEEFVAFQFAEIGAAEYMRRVSVAGHPGVAYDAGAVVKKDERGRVLYRADIPSSVVTWYDDGIGYSVGDADRPSRDLLPIAEGLAKR